MKQRTTFQTKEQEKNSRNRPNEPKISDLLDREFKTIVRKGLTKVKRT